MFYLIFKEIQTIITENISKVRDFHKVELTNLTILNSLQALQQAQDYGVREHAHVHDIDCPGQSYGNKQDPDLKVESTEN